MIVPEGIIFQSQHAYKNLRKMLVENYLWCVVSLPAGVFKPYSGVKTSILLMDKMLAKKTNKILFVKIENDGFDLGDQRRPIDKNDLPKAGDFIKNYKLAVMSDKDIEDTDFAHTVEKSKIAESGDWNLSGERYQYNIKKTSQTFPFASIMEIANPNHPYAVGDGDHGQIKSTFYKNDGIPYIRVGDIDWNGNISLDKMVYISEEIHNRNKKSHLFPGDIIISKTGATIGKVAIIPDQIKQANTTASVGKITVNNEIADSKYVLYCMMSDSFQKLIWSVSQKSAQPGFNIKDLKSFQIPLPPLDVQKVIVAEINDYQKIIDGARQVVDNYKPTIKIEPDWPISPLGQLAKNLDGKRIPISKFDRRKGEYPYYGASGIVDYVDDYIFDDDLLLISEDGANLLARVTPIAFSVSGKCWVNNHAHVLKFDNKETQIFVEIYLNSISLEHYVTGAAQPKLNQAKLNSIPIPLPSSTIQKEIVGQIESEQQIVNANKKTDRDV
ncbi:hypothetical protein ES703_85042 [subsurface metagenome]